MTIMDKQWSALSVPYAIEDLDRVRKERYFDPDFFGMEAELLWPRVWQMACRLEEIPNVGDVVEYEILDQSVIVIPTTPAGTAGCASSRAGARDGVDSSVRSTAGATGPMGATPA
jgi:hypothetical protein